MRHPSMWNPSTKALAAAALALLLLSPLAVLAPMTALAADVTLGSGGLLGDPAGSSASYTSTLKAGKTYRLRLDVPNVNGSQIAENAIVVEAYSASGNAEIASGGEGERLTNSTQNIQFLRSERVQADATLEGIDLVVSETTGTVDYTFKVINYEGGYSLTYQLRLEELDALPLGDEG